MNAEADDLIGAWLDGGLDAAGERRLAALAESDPEVAERLLRTLALDAQLASVLREEAGPEAMARAVQARLAAQGGSRRFARTVVKRIRRRNRRGVVILGWLAAASVAAGLLITLLVSNASPPPPATPPVVVQPEAPRTSPVQTPAPSLPVVPEPQVAEIVPETSSGIAEITIPGRDQPVRLRSRERFVATQACEAAVGGTAAMLRIDAGSEFMIADDADGLMVDLALGAIHATVQPVPAGRTFTVQTALARAVVVGTAFSVLATADGTTVVVREGSVRVAGLSGEALVPAGQQVFVPLGRGALVVGPIKAK